MDVYPRRFRFSTPLIWVVCLLAVSVTATTAFASVSPTPPSLAGTWSGKYSGAFSGKFTIHWTLSKSKLSGTIALSNPRGKYGINGRVRGKAISFGAVGVGATYTGSVSGPSMSGNYESPQGGGSWSAHKTSSG